MIELLKQFLSSSFFSNLPQSFVIGFSGADGYILVADILILLKIEFKNINLHVFWDNTSSAMIKIDHL